MNMETEKHELRPSLPVAYIALRNDTLRHQLVDALHGTGWRVVERNSGYHLIAELADVILDESARAERGLIVVEESLHGCRGSSIAQGLRELGIGVPIVVVAPPDAALETPDDATYLIEPEYAVHAVSAIARHVHAQNTRVAVA